MGRNGFVDTIVSYLIMVATKVFQRLLWILRYPSFTKESGMYRVGAIQTRLSDESVACQIHYPTTFGQQQQHSSNVFTPYFRSNAIHGLSDYSKTSASLLQYLNLRQHPCQINAEPISIFEDNVEQSTSSSSSFNTVSRKKKKFPIVLFSHGLGGCMEMYTQFCQQLSSYGYIVIALEHEDGSGAYAERIINDNKNKDETTRILYKRPDDSPYSRTKVVTFRQPFLQKRVDEINTIINILLENKNDKSNNIQSYQKETMPSVKHPLLDKILQISDTSKGISFVGHSFGAACMILASQQAFKTSDNNSNNQEQEHNGKHRPNSISVFDPWCFSLSDEVLKQGIVGGLNDDNDNDNNVPILSILSENWATKNPETEQIDYWLQSCSYQTNKIESYYIPNTAHASISDASTWLPRFIGKRVYMCHPNEQKHITIPFAAKVCANHILQSISTSPYLPSGSISNDEISQNQVSNTHNYLQEYRFQSHTTSTGSFHTNITTGDNILEQQKQPVFSTVK
jgi:dienelactone hydrolase